MALFEWKDSYSVQIKEIDNQHKRLVEMINNLHEAMAAKQAKEKLEEILNGMVEYTVTHFKTEEDYFTRFGYAETEDHIHQHETFVKKVDQFRTDFKSGKIMLSIDVINFLKDWLIKHINGSDQRYVDCFKENGLA